MKKNKIEHYSDKEALDFHNTNKSGKIEIISSKPMTSKRDLALAYSPGVAAPVKAISKNPDLAYDYTTKGNLVAVISNGSAILGLGNLGAIASKPVMEGKAVLFKRFADIDSIDLEIDSENPDEIINSIKRYSTLMIEMDSTFNIGVYSETDKEISILADKEGLIYKPSGAGGGDLGIIIGDNDSIISKFMDRLSKLRMKQIELI